eukprot:scaffold1384_cov116-Cylindrotheca_fusiformis.AAC.24
MKESKSSNPGTESPPFEVDSGSDVGDEPVFEKSKDQALPEPKENAYNHFWQRQAKRMARIPRIYLGVATGIAILFSIIAFTVGGFEGGVDNAGWQSRGTPIGDRQTQLMMVDTFQKVLATGDPAVWNELQTNVQDGWESGSLGNAGERASEDEDTGDRRLIEIKSGFHSSGDVPVGLRRSLMLGPEHRERLLQEPLLEGCDTTWYFNASRLEDEEHLWPIWKSKSSSTTLLSPPLIYDLCVAEQNTQQLLEANGLCFGCDEGCLPPFSPVLYARLTITDGFSLDCQELSDNWGSIQAETESAWASCSSDLKKVYDPINEYDMPKSCPPGFSPALVEGSFDETEWLTFTSSIFATSEADIDAMYDIVDDFDRGSGQLLGAYDTQYEGFSSIFTDSVVGRDMLLACASAVITTLAMLVHTKSPFITVIGLLQVILSFPLSFFVYTFIGGLDFFPFLNFIGVFVVFALGADNVFVTVDKWKNARIAHPTAETAIIAAISLPDAATAMFLTTSTTAIAFFGTAICPVAPVSTKLFHAENTRRC